MRKAEITRRIAAATGLTQVKADDVVDAILDEIKVSLQRGDAVTLRRFGSFGVRDKGSRLGRNPKTGQSAAIVARRVVRFKAGGSFKTAVKDASAEQAPPECGATSSPGCPVSSAGTPRCRQASVRYPKGFTYAR
jgi:integration host factor subunit alpha